MGKPTGFMEYNRQNALYREPLERIQDWKEISSLPPEESLMNQAARCMDCGVPFCQNGSVIGGMTTGCPIFNLIPEWNDLVYRGKWKEAYERLSKTNPFPEFTGRACPAPCEAGCVASLYESSVTIKNIELAIIEKAFEEGWVKPQIPKERTGFKIAVVGSGPAGLACAHELNKYGHSVTVIERSDRIGGLLTYGIPKMKIEQYVVDRRIKLMEQSGISFLTHVEVGKNYSIERLREEFDAIVLCIGSTKPRDIEVKGRNLKGIHFAMDFLHANTKSLLDSNLKNGQFISAEGKDVVVIGGGDTAVDCIATCIRQNCKSVVQFDIYPKRPEERAQDNPWPQYPMVYKLEYGQQEAFAKFGHDPRMFATTALEFIGDEEGKLVAIKSVGMKTTLNEKGEKVRQPVPDTEQIISAQLALIAIGFEGPELQLFKCLNLDAKEIRNSGSYQTNIDNIFVAGDARRGQSLIVWAIQEGKEAAKSCHEYITNKVNLSI